MMPIILPKSFKVNVFWQGADILQYILPNVSIVQRAVLKTQKEKVW